MFELLNVCYLVCSPVHPSLSARVDVDEQQPFYHGRVVQLKHARHEKFDLLLHNTAIS